MEYYIPSNFEDSGKIAGLFGIRNVIEAGILSLPFIYLSFAFFPGGLTWKIIIAAVFAIPTGGMALMGVNDDCLSLFAKSIWQWYKNKRIYEYRGEVLEKGSRKIL